MNAAPTRDDTALRDSEQRYRTLFEAIDSGFCVIEMIFGDDGRATDYRFIEANPAFERQSGLIGAVGRRIREFAPDLEEHWFDRYGRVALTGEPMRVEGEAAQLGRWFDIDAFRVGAPGQRRVAVLFTDISARHRAEASLRESEAQLRRLSERQQLLLAELQHRVRNILTVVRSVFNRTADRSSDLADLLDHFRGRLDALARTQVIATQTVGGTVDLETLVRDELLSVGVGMQADDGVQVQGPDVSLPPAAAESLGLALHELTTNALKYGALKVADATLNVGWSINMDDVGGPRLDLVWTEQGVPAVPFPPSREGFGRELIEHALPYRLGAKTEFAFKGGGVECRISVPLARAGLDTAGTSG